MDLQAVKSARQNLAAELGMSIEDLDSDFEMKLAAVRQQEEGRTPACLGYAEWEAYHEGRLSDERQAHAATCVYCARLMQAMTTEPEAAIAFAHKAIAEPRPSA